MKKRFRFSSSRDNFPNSFNFQVTGEWHGLTPVLSFHLKHSEPVKMKLHRSRLLTRPRPCTMPYHRTRLSTRTLQDCGRFVVIKWNFFSLPLQLKQMLLLRGEFFLFFLLFFGTFNWILYDYWKIVKEVRIFFFSKYLWLWL